MNENRMKKYHYMLETHITTFKSTGILVNFDVVSFYTNTIPWCNSYYQTKVPGSDSPNEFNRTLFEEHLLISKAEEALQLKPNNNDINAYVFRDYIAEIYY